MPRKFPAEDYTFPYMKRYFAHKPDGISDEEWESIGYDLFYTKGGVDWNRLSKEARTALSEYLSKEFRK